MSTNEPVPHPIKVLRTKLGLTQADLAAAIGCTQGNVGHYENGQTVPPDAAKRIIVFACTRGLPTTYEDIYGPPVAIAAA